jgi:hypothetical protein
VDELDLHSVGVDEVEHGPETICHYPDLRSRNTTGIKPSCPRVQFVQRLCRNREMIETSTRGVELFPFVACMLAQVKDVSAQAEDGHATGKRRTSAVVRRDQELRSNHVAVKPQTVFQAGDGKPNVMQSS